MTGVFIFIEWLASVNEMLCGLVWTQAIMEKQFDKKHHRLFLVLIAGLIAAGIILLNLFDLRANYITSLYVIFALLLGNCILYKGKVIELFMITIGYTAILLSMSALLVRTTIWIGIPMDWTSTFGLERVGVISAAECSVFCITGITYAVIKRIKRSIPIWGAFATSIICVCIGSLGYCYLFLHSGVIDSAKLNGFQLTMGIMLIFVMMVLYLWLQMRKEKKEKAYTIQQNIILEKNYVATKESYETNAKLYHDMKNHFLLLQSYLKANRVEEAEAYLKKLSGDGMRSDYERYTGIEAIDYILSQKREKAENNHIHMKIHGEYPKDCKIDPVDLCTIFTNLLDNAFEACMKQPEGEPREIQVKIRRLHQFIIIKIANNSIVSPDIRNGKLHTSKNDRNLHGWGMRSVLSAVEKYQGTVQYEYHEKIFTVSVMLFYQ